MDVYGIMLSVIVGFLYMDVLHPVGGFWMVMSKQFIVLFVSITAVNFRLGVKVV
jgi:hypothetical protein